MKEEWRKCIGLEGYYEVSNLGSVKTVARVTTRSNGVKLRIREIIRMPSTSRGYKVLRGSCDGVKVNLKVHRLVAMAFLEGEPKEMVNHKDGDKANNDVNNLEWATRSENELHAYRTGLKKSSDLHKQRTSESNKARRTIEHDVIHYIRCAATSQYKLAAELGLSRSMVGMIQQRKRYADV